MILALQTYTVRKASHKALAKTLSRIRNLGITHLELARIPFTMATADLVLQSGLQVLALQVKPTILEKEHSAIVAFCQATHCRWVVASVLSWDAILGGKYALSKFSQRLNQLATLYAESGIGLAFHHHDFEFRKLKTGVKFDELIRQTNPNVRFILDTYWVRRAGQDPRNWILRLQDRLVGLHLRDCAPSLGKKKPPDCALGQGIIDFPGLLAAIPNSVLYGAIEQNTKDPWSEIETSMKFWKSLSAEEIKHGKR